MTRLACLSYLTVCLISTSTFAWTDNVLNFLQDDTDLGIEVINQVKTSLNQEDFDLGQVLTRFEKFTGEKLHGLIDKDELLRKIVDFEDELVNGRYKRDASTVPPTTLFPYNKTIYEEDFEVCLNNCDPNSKTPAYNSTCWTNCTEELYNSCIQDCYEDEDVTHNQCKDICAPISTKAGPTTTIITTETTAPTTAKTNPTTEINTATTADISSHDKCVNHCINSKAFRNDKNVTACENQCNLLETSLTSCLNSCDPGSSTPASDTTCWDDCKTESYNKCFSSCEAQHYNSNECSDYCGPINNIVTPTDSPPNPKPEHSGLVLLLLILFLIYEIITNSGGNSGTGNLVLDLTVLVFVTILVRRMTRF